MHVMWDSSESLHPTFQFSRYHAAPAIAIEAPSDNEDSDDEENDPIIFSSDESSDEDDGYYEYSERI
jgi:hypothetical protein